MKRPMDLAYEYIKERILKGIFLPSQKLNESDLAEEIGVSRNTIKKALFKLEQDHLIEMEENKGATVKSFTLKEVINYFEIREVLEALIIRSSAEKITDEQIKKLELIVEQMNLYLREGDFEAYSELNKEFHQIIYDASDNKQATEMVNIIKTQLLRYHIRTIFIPGRNENSIVEHQNIFVALKNRDADQAEEAIRTHISNIRKTIEKNSTFLI